MRVQPSRMFGLLTLALLFSGLAAARELPDFTDLAEQNSPVVVNISTHQASRVGRARL